MLMLQRNQGQSLILIDSQGNRIRILLDKAGRRWGKIGVSAPQNWKILREELEERPDGKIPISLPELSQAGDISRSDP